MKTRYILFRRDNGVYYTEDTTTGNQSCLRTRDEAEAKSLLNATNEAQRQPVLNLHLARAYLTTALAPPAGIALAMLTSGAISSGLLARNVENSQCNRQCSNCGHRWHEDKKPRH